MKKQNTIFNLKRFYNDNFKDIQNYTCKQFQDNKIFQSYSKFPCSHYKNRGHIFRYKKTSNIQPKQSQFFKPRASIDQEVSKINIYKIKTNKQNDKLRPIDKDISNKKIDIVCSSFQQFRCVGKNSFKISDSSIVLPEFNTNKIEKIQTKIKSQFTLTKNSKIPKNNRKFISPFLNFKIDKQNGWDIPLSLSRTPQ